MVSINDVESALWERERDAWTGGPSITAATSPGMC
jgi:hypothetical protein